MKTILHVWLKQVMLFLVFQVILIMAGDHAALALDPPDKQPPHTVTIAYNVDNPPLKFKNSQQQADGILIDIWKLWSKKTGIRVIFKDARFADTIEMVKTGRADIHAGLFYTEDRDLFLDYTLPLMDIDYFIYHHESLKGINTLKDLLPFRTGVPAGYTRMFMEENLPGAAVSVYDDYPLVFDAAVNRKIQIFISPVMNHDYYFQTQKITSPFRYDPARPVYKRVYLGAVQKGNTGLQHTVNQGIKQIHPDEITAIQKNWLKNNENIKKTYIVACDSNYSPLTMLNEKGQPAGLFVDIWRLWAQKQGVHIKFIFDNRDGSIRAVEKGLADFHAGFENSYDDLAGSDPFYELSATVFVPLKKDFTSIFELNNKGVASIDAFYAEQLKKKHPALKMVIATDFDDIFGKLTEQKIEGFIEDTLVAQDLFFRQGRQNEFGAIPDFSVTSSISAVTRKTNTALLDFINQGLASIPTSEFLKLENKWLKDPEQGHYHTLNSPVNLTPEEKNWLKTHRKFKVGVDPQFHPFEFIDPQGLHSGAVADYLALIEKMLDIEFDVAPDLSWQQVTSLAEQKKLDVLSAVTQTPERSKFLNFTEPYLKYPIVIATRKETPPMEGLESLSGIKTALVRNYASTELVLKNRKDIVPIFVDTVYQGLETVMLGKADAYIGDVATISFQIQQYSLINLKINARTPLETEGLAIGVRNDYPRLASILDKALAAITPEEHMAIRKRWVRIEMPGSETSASRSDTDIHINLTQSEKNFIRNHPVIRIAGDPQFFPFEFFDKQGRYSGIASDYVNLLNKRLGIEMTIVPNLSWPEAMEKSRKKEIDVLPCIGVTRERLKFLNFSDSYISRYVVIITRTDAPLILRTEDLANKKVAVREDTFHEGFLRDRTDITPVLYKKLQEGLMDLSAGKTDAMVGDVSSSMFWIKKLHLTNLKVAAPATYEPQTLHFAVRKDWPELASIINKGLASISTEQENQFLNNWISVKYDPGLDPSVLWLYARRIIFISAILFILALLWSYSLKREINERKKAEEKIKKYAKELKAANIELKSLDKLKSMFIASMSHELRTPLNSIIGFTGVILQGMTGELNEKQKDQLGRVYKSAKHLLNLISDVIDISKIEAGRIDVFPESFNLKDVVDEAVINIQPLLDTKQITLTLDVPEDIIMETDQKRLLQCLINYLSNAAKYTEQGRVFLRVIPSSSDITIEVEDTGIGIDKKDIPKLFNAFERIDSHLKITAGGTGLGLYLTRKLVTEILQGKAMVKSTPGKGSVFGFTIPRKLDTQAAQDPEI
ncbi:MAG: transporter substrate-binding domain-containing protein [Proteobacteria bacterium]|nr:transporter substrate-binding domain-containing protein [Pseudomonadota bacterium]MBU1386690.1 transporter substrate-binding domain-containing protein [Pseudomonadota bacterium]MBU1543301.1 transporter substrate-binding domain-containing protein [Pseudomonadota bacterium]MBU2429945.1 transporter substrate-binding domain-containing protein [Pseudomonadota bacterium]MBU2483132.1 transporter substrate-binding domain-containing protein [Pseudomonadota bacterium]